MKPDPPSENSKSENRLREMRPPMSDPGEPFISAGRSLRLISARFAGHFSCQSLRGLEESMIARRARRSRSTFSPFPGSKLRCATIAGQRRDRMRAGIIRS